MIRIITIPHFDNCDCSNIDEDIIKMINDRLTFHAKDHILIMEIE